MLSIWMWKYLGVEELCSDEQEKDMMGNGGRLLKAFVHGGGKMRITMVLRAGKRWAFNMYQGSCNFAWKARQ